MGFKELGLKNLGDFHDLYVQSDTLLLADVFENFRNKFIEIYEFDAYHFCLHLDYHGKVVWKRQLELELLTNIDMLLMVENYTKNYDKGMESSYLMYFKLEKSIH